MLYYVYILCILNAIYAMCILYIAARAAMYTKCYICYVYTIYIHYILQRERQQKLQEAKLKLEADNSDLTFKPEMNDKSLRLAARIAAETHMQVAMRPSATSVWGVSLQVIQLCGRQSLRLAAR